MLALATRKIRDAFWNFVVVLTLTDTTLAEFQSSTMLLAMGALLLDSYPTLSTLVPVHVLMRHIMPEWSWGVLFFGFGSLQSIANIARASYPRKLLAFVAACIFGLLAGLGASVHPIAIFFPIFATAALVQSVVYLRIAIARDGAKKLSSGEFRKVRL